MKTMQATHTLDDIRLAVFRRRCSLAWPRQIVLSLGMAALTGLAAQFRIPLPFTPVPITGQVFAVLLSGVLLGRMYGGLSQVFYVGLGLAGIPWFTGGVGGIPVLPTIGYLIGFPLAAVLIGWLTENYVQARHFLPQVGLMMLGVLVIYACGALGFACVTGSGLRGTLVMGVAPFLPVDLLKAILAAGLTTSILPRQPYEDKAS